jgi:CBS domain-containing protein
MSPRAACRLERFGFSAVFDFVHGKSFWLAHGLPIEGAHADRPTAGTAADPDPPVCHVGDSIAIARRRIAERPGWDHCIVTSSNGIVAGRLRAGALESDPSATVDAVMEPGPTTIRPDTDLTEVTDRMTQHEVASIVVTDPRGRLLGVLRHRGHS